MSQSGQSRHFDRTRATSDLPPITDLGTMHKRVRFRANGRHRKLDLDVDMKEAAN
jgi:hypothetical protein